MSDDAFASGAEAVEEPVEAVAVVEEQDGDPSPEEFLAAEASVVRGVEGSE